MCALGPCRTPADLLVCAVEEVPLGCPNSVELAEPGCELTAYLARRDVHVTPAAVEKLIPRSLGDEAGTIKGLLSVGRLALLKPRVLHPIKGVQVEGGRPARFEAEPPLEATAVTSEEIQTWIKFKVIDDETDEPISGVSLQVIEPNGTERDYTTRADGIVEIDPIERGTCDVSSVIEGASLRGALWFVALGEAATVPAADAARPAGWRDPLLGSRITLMREYKVQTGDSLDSVATANAITWQRLAEFNWDTSSPKKINEHLRDDVGCTRKTADGHNYIFDSSDDPGIIYIPQRWEEAELETQKTHVIRVTRPYRLEPWHFSI